VTNGSGSRKHKSIQILRIRKAGLYFTRYRIYLEKKVSSIFTLMRSSYQIICQLVRHGLVPLIPRTPLAGGHFCPQGTSRSEVPPFFFSSGKINGTEENNTQSSSSIYSSKTHTHMIQNKYVLLINKQNSKTKHNTLSYLHWQKIK